MDQTSTNQNPNQGQTPVVDPLAPAQQPVVVPIQQPQPVATEQPAVEQQPPTAEIVAPYQNQAPAQEIQTQGPKLPELKTGPAGPSFYGYKPPKWANDFEHVRLNKGKGKDSDSETWLLYLVDRLLKMHS